MNSRPKILIVDDKRENLVALQTVLRDLPVEIITAQSGNEALKYTLYHDFALALLDIQMPGMDGYELAGILRQDERTVYLPFIFISAVYTDNMNVFKGYEQGAFSFITKPFQPEILINKVKFFIDKHQQELALYNLNRELEAFTYSVSHDLRAPLRAISGFSQILKEEITDNLNADARDALDEIIINIKKMGQLIDDLLEFSRLGKQHVSTTLVDMNNLFDTVVNDITKLSTQKAKLIIKPLQPVQGDRAMLKQVAYNLVSNALKYSANKEKPVIEIGCKDEENAVTYYVKDNGAGFNMNYYDKLFKVFQRLHGFSEFEGTGVGLAIVQRIISKHNGEVWAEGKENEGAVFYFSLPINNIKDNV